MGVIIDADVIIQGEKGLFDFTGWLKSRPDEQFELAAITVAELWHGVERASGSVKEKRLQYLHLVLETFPIIPYTKEIAQEHAQIWAHLETIGKKISPYDLLVAATALHVGSAVATFNRRHFENIPGLNLIQPK